MAELRCIGKIRHRYWIFLLLALIIYSIVICIFVKSLGRTSESDEVVPAPDRRFLINLKDFDYIINQKSCRQLQMQPKFIILIHSAPMKRRNRDNIRQTWGGWKVDHRVIFLLGKVISDEYDLSEDIQRIIQTESDFHKDIVQGNFIDSYKNLSYKHVMAMKWATEFCPETQFIFKSDDDIFVNTPFMLKFVNGISYRKNLLFCPMSWKPNVVRDEGSKWYVSPEEYPNSTYPVYCSGCAVLLSIDVAQKLHKAAENTPFFWVDDVYVLGMLREKINVKITGVWGFMLMSSTTDEIFNAKTRNITNAVHYMFSYELKNEQIRQIWEVVKGYQERGYYVD